MIDALPAPSVAEVVAGVEGRVGRLLLNRPEAINALSLGMIHTLRERLDEWAESPDVLSVEIAGAGQRGLCAGADVRELRRLVLAGDSDPMEFLLAEYELNARIASFPKPYEALMSGIVMGGGLGVSAHGSLRWVTPTSRLAMPETIIGFFPDVGMLWHLGRAPGEAGTHLALTGGSVDAATAIWLGLADAFTVAGQASEPADLAADWITDCYEGSDPVEVVGRLGQHRQGAARAAAADLRARSPLAVAVTLEALRRAQAMASVREVLEQDARIAANLVVWPDFAEGVRARLVDKDDRPRWTHDRLEDVSRSEVLAILGE